jgi:hypothetical protein
MCRTLGIFPLVVLSAVEFLQRIGKFNDVQYELRNDQSAIDDIQR